MAKLEMIGYNSTMLQDHSVNCNHSEEPGDATSIFTALATVFKIGLTIATVLLNCLVIFIIARLSKNKKRSFSNYLFLSSAIADLVVGLTAEPLMIAYVLKYPTLVGKNSCFYWLILNHSCLFLNISLFNLLVTTIHRYNQVNSALVHDKPTNFRYVLIFLVWALCSSFWLLMLIPIALASQRNNDKQLFECNYLYPGYIILSIEFITLITPIGLIVVFNILTYHELKTKAIKMQRIKLDKKFENQFKTFNNRILSNSDNCLNDRNHLAPNDGINDHGPFSSKRSFNLKYVNNKNNSNTSNLTANSSDIDIYRLAAEATSQEKKLGSKSKHLDYFRRKLTKERKAFLTLFCISVSLILSWLLFLIVWPLRAFCHTCVSDLMFKTSVWLNCSSAAANPLILIIFHSKLRHEFYALLALFVTYIRQIVACT